MPNLRSVNKFVNLCVYNATKMVIEKPKIVPILKSELKLLTPVFSPIKQQNRVSIDDVMQLFDDGKINGGYLRFDMYLLKTKMFFKTLFDKKGYKLWKHSVDLSNELKLDDYNEIKEFMNLHNGKFINDWKKCSDYDKIPNYQKLALFVRSVRRAKELDFFKNLSEQEWATCMDGIINRPRNVIKSLLDYKMDSSKINYTASTNEGKNAIKQKVKDIEEYLNTQKTKSELKVYRGEGQFGIFSQVNIDDKTTLDKLLEPYTDEIKKGLHSQNEIDEFIDKFLINRKTTQKRFLSTGLARKAGEEYAKKLLWNIKVPKGTNASMIEGYNVERKAEYELLIQRNSILKIKKAIFDPINKRWEMWADLCQQS